MKKMNIGFFADGPWSHEALKKMLSDSSFKIIFVCGRYQSFDRTLKDIAENNKIDFFSHPNINSIEFLTMISKYYCEIFVSMSFDQIFRAPIINIPAFKIINCHAGKLPFYRGRNVLNWALINDEKEFGITVHFVDEGIDTGDIILQRCYEIKDEDDYSTLLFRAYNECSRILYDSLKILQLGNLHIIKQKDIHPLGFYCSQRRSGDERVVWNQNSRDIFNFVRAICDPGPQARTYLYNSEIKINKLECFKNQINFKGIPGAVIGVEENSFIVKTSDSYVRILQWTNYPKPRIGDRFL